MADDSTAKKGSTDVSREQLIGLLNEDLRASTRRSSPTSCIRRCSRARST